MTDDIDTIDCDPIALAPVRPQRRLAATLLDYNPFYLLSALCMLGGLLALNNSLTFSPLPVHRLLLLILILNVYEAMVIVLAMVLARRGLIRDVTTLLILEVFFLVDVGFLNSEIFTFDFEVGLWVNLALLLVTAIKLAGIFAAVGLSPIDLRYLLVLIQMFVLLGMPGLFKQVSTIYHGVLPVGTVYGVWWIVGLIPLMYLALRKGATGNGIVAALVLLPGVSIIAHLATSNWVYHVPWHHANLSPLLLGLASAVGACDRHIHTVAARMRLHLLLPVGAIMLALWSRHLMPLTVYGFPLTPLQITLLAASLVYLHGMIIHRHAYFGLAGVMCLGAAGLGNSPASMGASIRTILSWFWGLIPRTVTQWGAVAVGASFVLLAMGGIVSFLKLATRRQQLHEHS